MHDWILVVLGVITFIAFLVTLRIHFKDKRERKKSEAAYDKRQRIRRRLKRNGR